MNAPVKSLLHVEWRPLRSLESIMDDWRGLAGRALEPNIFYEPAFATAAAALGRDVSVGLVWSGTVARRLIGLFPARIETTRYGLPLPVLVGWTHPYGPLGTPLVDRDLAGDVIAAWLEYIDRDPAMPSMALLPLVPTTGAFATALDTALIRGHSRQAAFDSHRRALLAPGDRGGYLQHSIGGKRRKELRRQRRRLEDNAALTLTIAITPAAVAEALGAFLALEASGWKGRAGTAAADDDAIREFMARAVIGLAQEGKAEVHRLMLDGRTAAAAIMLRSGDTAWFWKIAYEEALARYSPGVLLAADLTESILTDPAIARADSCATADHPMIDHIWRERLPLADRLVMVRGGRGFGFALAARLEGARRFATSGAKRLRNRLRGNSV